jgi:hypothetical protein
MEKTSMSPRTLRRAAERQTAKLAAKAGKAQAIEVPATKVMSASASLNGGDQPFSTLDFVEPSGDTMPPANHQISDARLAANRANAQLSTGPSTSEGKAKSSLNAVKTGLTGRTVLLPTDDALAYQQHLDRHFVRLAPATDEEHTLVQFIADTEWRLLRIAPLEASLYALGRRELAHTLSDEPDPVNREALLLGNIFVIYRRDLNNLALQERRLRSQHKADSEKLQALQNERVGKEKAAAQKSYDEMQRAMNISNNAVRHRLRFDPADHGFEFSLDEFYYYCDQIDTHYKLTDQYPNVDKVLAAYRAAHDQE